MGISRLFAVLTLLEPKASEDGGQKVETVLSNSPLYHLGGKRLIAGLPYIDHEPPWVVEHIEDGDFMCVRNDLDFM